MKVDLEWAVERAGRLSSMFPNETFDIHDVVEISGRDYRSCQSAIQRHDDVKKVDRGEWELDP